MLEQGFETIRTPEDVENSMIKDLDTYHIIRYLQDVRNVAFIAWVAQDVLDRAEHLNIPCTVEQAEEIIENLNSQPDCEYGITWSSIDCELEELL